MAEYLTELEMFEKSTSVLEFESAVEHKGKSPYNFTKIIIRLAKDPSECTLHDVRKLKEAITSEAAIETYALYMEDVHAIVPWWSLLRSS